MTLTPERVSETRDGSPDRWRRRLRGDLDNIVLMALRKEARRRYASVEQLSEDIRRHLAGQPVSARKDSFPYRAGKFVQRNKVGVGAAFLLFTTLLAGIVVTTWQMRIARAERARAAWRFDDVRKLANSFMFKFHDAIKNLPGSTPARRLLINEALGYLDSLAQESGDDASLQRELANAYQQIGEIQQSGTVGRPHLGDTAGAFTSQRKALAIREALAAANPADVQIRRDLATSYTGVAQLLLDTGDAAGAIESHRKGLSIREALSVFDPTDTQARFALATDYRTLFHLYATNGNYRAADESLLKAVEMCEALFADGRTGAQVRRELLINHLFLGDEMWLQGDPARAWERYHRALTLGEEWVAEDPMNREALQGLHLRHSYIGDMFIRYALLEEEPNHEPIRTNAARTFYLLAQLLTQTGRVAEARDYTTRALVLLKAEADKPEPLGDRINNYAWALLTCDPADLRDPAAALPYAKRAAEKTREKDPNVLKTLALAYHRTGDHAQAVENADKALALLPSPTYGRARSTLHRELEAQLAESRAAIRTVRKG